MPILPVKASLALIIAFATTAIGGCGWNFPAFDPFGGSTVVVSDKPMLIGPTPTRLTPAEPLEVRGLSTEFCVVLSNDVSKAEEPDAAVARLTESPCSRLLSRRFSASCGAKGVCDNIPAHILRRLAEELGHDD